MSNAVVAFQPAPRKAVTWQYDKMRLAVRECARVDEAKDIHDKALAMELYARQREDKELEAWVAEIRLRACIRLGELSRDLDKARPNKGYGNGIPTGGNSKAVTLAEAGISTSAAGRYEEIAGGKTAQGIAAAEAATEAYFARTQEAGEAPNIAGLRTTIHAALVETLGPPPDRRRRVRQEPQEIDEMDGIFALFGSAIYTIAEVSAAHLDRLAGCSEPILVAHHTNLAERAMRHLETYLSGLKERAASDAT